MNVVKCIMRGDVMRLDFGESELCSKQPIPRCLQLFSTVALQHFYTRIPNVITTIHHLKIYDAPHNKRSITHKWLLQLRIKENRFQLFYWLHFNDQKNIVIIFFLLLFFFCVEWFLRRTTKSFSIMCSLTPVIGCMRIRLCAYTSAYVVLCLCGPMSLWFEIEIEYAHKIHLK